MSNYRHLTANQIVTTATLEILQEASKTKIQIWSRLCSEAENGSARQNAIKKRIQAEKDLLNKSVNFCEAAAEYTSENFDGFEASFIQNCRDNNQATRQRFSEDCISESEKFRIDVEGARACIVITNTDAQTRAIFLPIMKITFNLMVSTYENSLIES